MTLHTELTQKNDSAVMERVSNTIQAKDPGHFAGATGTVRDARCVKPSAPQPPYGAGTCSPRFSGGGVHGTRRTRSGRRTSACSWSVSPASLPPASLPITRCPKVPFDSRLGRVFGTTDREGGTAHRTCGTGSAVPHAPRRPRR